MNHPNSSQTNTQQAAPGENCLAISFGLNLANQIEAGIFNQDADNHQPTMSTQSSSLDLPIFDETSDLPERPCCPSPELSNNDAATTRPRSQSIDLENPTDMAVYNRYTDPVREIGQRSQSVPVISYNNDTQITMLAAGAKMRRAQSQQPFAVTKRYRFTTESTFALPRSLINSPVAKEADDTSITPAV